MKRRDRRVEISGGGIDYMKLGNDTDYPHHYPYFVRPRPLSITRHSAHRLQARLAKDDCPRACCIIDNLRAWAER